MNSQKYSRLPTSDPGPEFTALDGPSYFSYEIERKKYGSAFSYTGSSASSAETGHPAVGKIAIASRNRVTFRFISVDGFADC